jgi:hypothetical protein
MKKCERQDNGELLAKFFSIPVVIDINAIPYKRQKMFKWRSLEGLQREGDTWTQRCICEKTKNLGIRRGTYL